MPAYRQRTGKTQRIIIHASHTDQEGTTDLVSHLRVLGRRNGLLDIGYHFVIERDGRWENTRDVRSLGSHAPGHNHDSIGICLASHLGEYPNKSMMLALGDIVNVLMCAFGLLEIKGHHEVSPQRANTGPACPGFSMDQLREHLMNQYVDSKSRPGAKEEGNDDRQLYGSGGGSPDTLVATPNHQTVNYAGTALSEQNRIILEYLRTPHRTLTNLIALTNLGIGSLTSRIAELRQMGHQIDRETCKDFHGRRYIKYSLRESPDGA